MGQNHAAGIHSWRQSRGTTRSRLAPPRRGRGDISARDCRVRHRRAHGACDKLGGNRRAPPGSLGWFIAILKLGPSRSCAIDTSSVFNMIVEGPGPAAAAALRNGAAHLCGRPIRPFRVNQALCLRYVGLAAPNFAMHRHFDEIFVWNSPKVEEAKNSEARGRVQ